MGLYTERFEQLVKEYIPYYRNWTYDEPMIVSEKRNHELHAIQQVLWKCAEFYAAHYKEYFHFIDYPEKVKMILETAERYPFQAGLFRPDFLLCEDGVLRVCEITSRFFGNGYFLSWFYDHTGQTIAKEHGVQDAGSYFESFFEHMAGYAEGKSKLLVLKSADKTSAIRLYVPFYASLGLQTEVIEFSEWDQTLPDLKDTLVVSALNQFDLLSLPADALERLMEAGVKSDMRTVFLLHDKRFFRLFDEPSFTDRFLSPEETAFLREHTVKTFLPAQDEEVWDQAAREKDGFIVKNHWLGKSEQVFAGILTEEAEWKELMRRENRKEMILQPFMPQKIYPTFWQGKHFLDYVCGTILCVDDKYYGPGFFRTSSCPVINRTDDRKMAPVITDQRDHFANAYIL